MLWRYHWFLDSNRIYYSASIILENWLLIFKKFLQSEFLEVQFFKILVIYFSWHYVCTITQGASYQANSQVMSIEASVTHNKLHKYIDEVGGEGGVIHWGSFGQLIDCGDCLGDYSAIEK